MPLANTQSYYSVAKPTFQRAMRNILSITQGNPCVVVTSYNGLDPAPHQYMTGLIVRLLIPNGFGMQEANQLYAPITVIDANTFSMPIDTTNFEPFAIPPRQPGNYATPAQAIPTGEVNSILTEATQNVLAPTINIPIP